MIDKPKVGQRVFVRYGDSGNPEETAVTKVGVKYFEVEAQAWRPLAFKMETAYPGYWTEKKYGARICYRDEPSLEEKLKADALERELRQIEDRVKAMFRYYGRCPFTLDQMQRIEAIIKERKAQ